MFRQMIRQVYNAETYSLTGKIENIVGMSIEASGSRAAVGDICRIYSGDTGGQVTAEVVGFKNDRILLMPYSAMNGISAGNFVRNTGQQLTLQVSEKLRGRIINALGQPIDGKGPITDGVPHCISGVPINPLSRP
ncbi:MAG: flagellum-specific ATP synthase FliI, partial [Oscillospiraceae bacterium]|nr:flagellum-specific ATP synthase FliI [Oscillospiraceae bacterium]